MAIQIELISGGSVTSSAGFRAGATCAGIKQQPGRLDLALLAADVPCSAAGVFTRNRFRAAPVHLCEARLQDGLAQAIIINSGCANAGTGAEGEADALAMTGYAASKLSIPPEAVLVASTGIIGHRLPMPQIEKALPKLVMSTSGGHDFACAIMTTDTHPKEVAVRITCDGGQFTVAGAAKGSGMIHPDMATLLAFISTDVGVDARLLTTALRQAADLSFNMVSVDGDTSSNDSLIILANGASHVGIQPDAETEKAFRQGLEAVCVHLAREVVRDGEGATRLFEVRVSSAASVEDARKVARAITGSSLVKTAIHGADANWGRVLAAAGRSGAAFDESHTSLKIGGVVMFQRGRVQAFDAERTRQALCRDEVLIVIDLGLGTGQATGWGCDLSEDYVRINSEYST